MLAAMGVWVNGSWPAVRRAQTSGVGQVVVVNEGFKLGVYALGAGSSSLASRVYFQLHGFRSPSRTTSMLRNVSWLCWLGIFELSSV